MITLNVIAFAFVKLSGPICKNLLPAPLKIINLFDLLPVFTVSIGKLVPVAALTRTPSLEECQTAPPMLLPFAGHVGESGNPGTS